MSELAIEARGLCKVYLQGFWRKRFVGLDGLDLEVRTGEVFGYIGPNGAGKTTTLKLLMGLNFPTAGTARLLGRPVGDAAVRGRIGYLPERPYFYDHLTAEEFLHFYGSLHGMDRAARARRIDELLPMVHMERARHTPLKRFSKGMLQRVGVAQALINDPELVVLDEPSSGLDPMGRMLIRDLILRLKREGRTVLFASHVLSDVEDVCDRVGIIAGGRLRQVAPVRELVGHEIQSVEVVFDGLPDDAALPGEVFGGEGRRTFEAPTLEDANALVDAGRRAGGLLVALRPRRQTLEQLFVDEVAAIEKAEREAKR